MDFAERQHYSEQILGAAAWEAKSVVVVGSGIWFDGLEGSIVNLLITKYHPFTKEVYVLPALRAVFQNAGRIQFVDFGPPARATAMLGSRGVPPDLIYLVEDSPGVHLSDWEKMVEPFIESSCPVILLGDTSVDT
jgi:hypothetical protein